MLGYLASYLVLAITLVLNESEFISIISGFFAVYASHAVLTVFIGALATFRQETKKFWTYGEILFVMPQPTASKETIFVCETNMKNEKGRLIA